MKKRLHPFDLKHFRLRQSSSSNVPHIESKLLTKYFPKILKEFVMTQRNGAIESKIKGAKIIKAFKIASFAQNLFDWRVLFANKIKSVKALSNQMEPDWIFAKKMKVLSGLQSVKIFLNFLLMRNSSTPLDKRLEFFLSKACKNVGCLQNLQHLEVTPLTIGSAKCLKRLNSHKKLLESLKTFKAYFDWEGATDNEISELIENNKNLWRNVTSLKLGTLHSNFHFESFQKLGELCSKIKDIQFEFSCRDLMNQPRQPRRFSDSPFEVKTNYLQTLKTFQHLRVLNIQINDVFTLLKDFVLPLSIQSLRLDFRECLSKEIMLKIDQSFVEEELQRTFEASNLLLRFYDSFKGLDQLEALEMYFTIGSDGEAYRYQNSLLESLLKRISSPLKMLDIFPTIHFAKFSQASGVLDHSLPQLIQSCEKFASTLEKLNVGSLKAIYSNFDLSAYRTKFTNLSCINLRANFSWSQGADVNIIGLFLQNFILLGESITVITLEVSINLDAESLLSLLKQINELKMPSKLRIKLFLRFQQNFQKREKSMSFEDGAQKLQSNEKCYSKTKGVSVKPSGFLCFDGVLSFMSLYEGKFEKE